MGTNTVTHAILEDTLSIGFDDLDARMARFGYSPKVIADPFQLSQAEVCRLFSRQLDAERIAELSDLMRQAG